MTDPFFCNEPFHRTLYENNPLASVSAEIRFPPLLKLKNVAPSDFQELLIADYPVTDFQQQTEIGFNMANSAEPNVTRNQKYLFRSDDSVWTVAVTGQSFSVGTSVYLDWPDFLGRFIGALERFSACYPSLKQISRIGLRYQNVIDKAKIGLESRNWSDLFRPEIAGIMGIDNLSVDNLAGMSNFSQMKFGDNHISLRQELLSDSENIARKAMLLDADYFTETPFAISKDAVSQKLSDLHDLSGPLFELVPEN